MKIVKIDVAAGVIFVLLGAVFAIMALGYRMGTASMMGPGYFPFGVSLIMVALGAALIGSAFFQDALSERLDLSSLKTPLISLFWVLLAIVLFGFFLDSLGLIICIGLVVLAASFANDDFALGSVLARFMVLSTISVGVFKYGLGLSLPILPTIDAQGLF